jgi:hypothetical protein
MTILFQSGGPRIGPLFSKNQNACSDNGGGSRHNNEEHTMIIRTTTIALVASIIAAPAFADSTVTNKYEQAALDQEIRSCIDELGQRANYSGASEVRHEVTVTKRRSFGHRLDIETSVYSDADDTIRAYATRCIAYRDHRPFRISVTEADGGA